MQSSGLNTCECLYTAFQAQKSEEAWGREKKALMERLERLQKANKARRAELDDLTAQVLRNPAHSEFAFDPGKIQGTPTLLPLLCCRCPS